MLSVIRPNDIMTIFIMRSEFCLKDVMLIAIIPSYHMPSVFAPSVVMLSVIRRSNVSLTVVAPLYLVSLTGRTIVDVHVPIVEYIHP
jgi:hypothetical protein